MIEDREVKMIRVVIMVCAVVAFLVGCCLAFAICWRIMAAHNTPPMVREEIRAMVKPECLNPEHP